MTIKDLIWEFENGSISPYKLVEKLKETETDLKEVSTQDLRSELKLRGHQTDSLWHVEDVLQNYQELAVEEAEEVLERALDNERVIERVFEQIDYEVELIKKFK